MADVPKKFNVPKIVRQVGVKTEATVYVGKEQFKVYRLDRLYFAEHGLVKCAEYDNHFIFDNPSKRIGQWSPVCTCGSPAGIVGYNAYATDASPTTIMESTIPGEMVVCLSHTQTRKHADGST